jgi:hypothetical protein
MLRLRSVRTNEPRIMFDEVDLCNVHHKQLYLLSIVKGYMYPFSRTQAQNRVHPHQQGTESLEADNACLRRMSQPFIH